MIFKSICSVLLTISLAVLMLEAYLIIVIVLNLDLPMPYKPFDVIRVVPLCVLGMIVSAPCLLKWKKVGFIVIGLHFFAICIFLLWLAYMMMVVVPKMSGH